MRAWLIARRVWLVARRGWLVTRDGPFARLSSILVSGLFVLAFVLAGLSILPSAGAPDAVQVYEGAPPELASAAPLPLTVFVMRADRSVVRYGSAVREADGRLSVKIFESAGADERLATEAILFRPNLAVLWAVATDSSQEELKRRVDVIQNEAARAIESIITSEAFTVSYRPVLRAILTDAVTNAWEDPRTQSALEDLLVHSDAALAQMLHDDLQEIVVGRVKEAVWDMFQTNWLNAFGVPIGYELDYAPVLRAITATLLDPAVQETFVALGSERLETDEARRLAERLAIGLIDTLMRDRRMPEIVKDMYEDPRLREMVLPFSDSVMALFGALPRHLGGFGSESTLNPLAAHVFRAIVLGENRPLILFVTEEDGRRIERLELEAATFLRPVKSASGT